jgi:hypothetical protein
MVNHATNDAVAFHLTELLDEHLLGDPGDRALELGEAQDMTTEEPEQDDELPSALEELQSLLHVVRG